MSKKWYNLFVSVDQPGGQREETTGTNAAPSAAQATADIAATVAPEPKFSAPVNNPTSFDEIYSAAEIHPPVHGFTIMKVAEMLHSEHIRNLPRDVKRSSVLVALEASGAPLQEVIEDAVHASIVSGNAPARAEKVPSSRFQVPSSLRTRFPTWNVEPGTWNFRGYKTAS